MHAGARGGPRLRRGTCAALTIAALALAVPGAAPAATLPPGALQQLAGNAGCIRGDAGYSWIPCAGAVRGMYDVSSIAFSPDGRFAYAVSLESGYTTDSTGKVTYKPGGTIVAFSRDAETGALTQLPGAAGCIRDTAADLTPVTAPCTATARGLRAAKDIALSPDGRFAYVAGIESEAIAVFARDATTGALTQLPGAAGCVRNDLTTETDCSATAIGLHGVRWISISPDGRNLYASSPASDAIVAFSRNVETGQITQLPGADACIEDRLARIHSCPSTGVGLNYPRSLTVSPDGRNVYVSSDHADAGFTGDPADGDAIAVFSRDPQTGALHQLPGAAACIKDVRAPSNTACGTVGKGLYGAFEAVVTSDGRFVYTASAYGGTIGAFSRNLQTGALTQLPGAAACLGAYGCTPASGIKGANAITLSADEKVAYVSGFDGRSIAVFSRNAITGELTQMPGDAACMRDTSAGDTLAVCPVTIKGLNGPRKLVLSPDGRNAYVPASSGTTIAAFSIVPSPGDTGTGGGTAAGGGDSTPPPSPPTSPPSPVTPPDPPRSGGTTSGGAAKPGVSTTPPTPTPTPRPRTVRPQSPAVRPARTANVSRSGRQVSIRLANSAKSDARVTVLVTVTVPRGAAAVCSSKRVVVSAASSETAVLRLSRACVKALRSRGARVRVEVISRDATGAASRYGASVRIRH